MADYRDFQVKIISASDLKDVRHHGKMKVYAKVFITPDSECLEGKTTPVDKEGKTNPNWNNYPVKCLIPEDAVQQEDQRNKLVIKLYCRRSLHEDQYVGEVNISLKELFDGGLSRENVDYTVHRNDAQGTYGTLRLSYSFGESTQKINVQEESGSTGGQSSSTAGGQGNRRRSRRFLKRASEVAGGLLLTPVIAVVDDFVARFFADDEQEESE